MQRAASNLSIPPIWWVTHGTQEGAISDCLHSGLWGLARTVRVEEPSLHLRCLDLDSFEPASLASDLKHWLSILGESGDETEVSIVSTPQAEASCALDSADVGIDFSLLGTGLTIRNAWIFWAVSPKNPHDLAICRLIHSKQGISVGRYFLARLCTGARPRAVVPRLVRSTAKTPQPTQASMSFQNGSFLQQPGAQWYL